MLLHRLRANEHRITRRVVSISMEESILMTKGKNYPSRDGIRWKNDVMTITPRPNRDISGMYALCSLFRQACYALHHLILL